MKFNWLNKIIKRPCCCNTQQITKYNQKKRLEYGFQVKQDLLSLNTGVKLGVKIYFIQNQKFYMKLESEAVYEA